MFFCGYLDHLDMNCKNHKDGKPKLYKFGDWLRAEGQNNIIVEDVKEELDRLNANLSENLLKGSP